MQAYWYEQKGAAGDVLRFDDMPTPEPGSGEVRVRVARSAINPTDCKRREIGRELDAFPRIIPNNDGSGIIDAVGGGVDEGRVGERVWIFGAQAMRPFGTAAEYCVIPSDQARHLGDTASFDDGACLGVPAVTAHRAVFADGNVDGKVVLVSGAAGRVGAYAVQLAKLAGALVIATAGPAEKVAYVKSLGADHALSYRDGDLAACVAEVTDGRGVDRMIDVAFGVNVAQAPSLIRVNGTLTSYGSDAEKTPVLPFYEFMYKNILIRPFAIFGMPADAKQAAFRDIEKHLADGALTHRIDKRFTFDDMVAAHEAIEGGDLFGCCVVTVDESR